MSVLKIEIARTCCVFVLQIETPTDTLRRLALLFQDHQVVLNDFNLHRYQEGTAIVIVHAMIEKRRIDDVTSLLHLLPGVLQVQRMEGK
jgi:hypothetical protein